MSATQTRETPLAWSQTGDKFELPDEAVLWRVRRLSGSAKGGAPELVYGADGLPLIVEVTITPADFGEVVEGKHGRYRLDALDEQRKPVAGVPAAYFMVSPSSARPERQETAASDVALRTLADALKQQSDKLGDAFKQQSEQIHGLVTQVREFAQCLVAARVVVQEVAPASAAVAALAPRNGTSDPDDDENDDQDDDENDDGDDGDAPHEPDWFDRARDFCATVPPENLRVIGELAPTMVADGVRKVIRGGLAGLIIPDDSTGGDS